MRSFNIFCFLLVTLAFTGCSKGPTVLENKASTTSYPKPDVPPAPSTFGLPNTAPTLKPIITAYYKSIDSRNEAALRKVVTAHFIAAYQNAIKDTKTSVIQYLVITEDDVKHPLEVRNEIFYQGDAGVQVRVSNGGWKWIGLTQENDAWKVTDHAEFPQLNLPD